MAEPEFLKASHLYKATEEKLIELSDHCEPSSYLKDGKFLQFPISRHQKSGEVEWWKTFRKQIEEKENVFVSLIPTKKPTILRRNIEGNLITLSHYITII